MQIAAGAGAVPNLHYFASPEPEPEPLEHFARSRSRSRDSFFRAGAGAVPNIARLRIPAMKKIIKKCQCSPERCTYLNVIHLELFSTEDVGRATIKAPRGEDTAGKPFLDGDVNHFFFNILIDIGTTNVIYRW